MKENVIFYRENIPPNVLQSHADHSSQMRFNNLPASESRERVKRFDDSPLLPFSPSGNFCPRRRELITRPNRAAIATPWADVLILQYRGNRLRNPSLIFMHNARKRIAHKLAESSLSSNVYCVLRAADGQLDARARYCSRKLFL